MKVSRLAAVAWILFAGTALAAFDDRQQRQQRRMEEERIRWYQEVTPDSVARYFFVPREYQRALYDSTQKRLLPMDDALRHWRAFRGRFLADNSDSMGRLRDQLETTHGYYHRRAEAQLRRAICDNYPFSPVEQAKHCPD